MNQQGDEPNAPPSIKKQYTPDMRSQRTMFESNLNCEFRHTWLEMYFQWVTL